MRPRRRKGATDLDVFIDIPRISKSALAEVVGVSRSTLLAWENLAFWRLTEFRKAYPQKDGIFLRESPLTAYQSWVIGKIGRLMSQLNSTELVRMALTENPHQFSKYRYQQAQKALQKLEQKGA
jgi:hypothetical protein